MTATGFFSASGGFGWGFHYQKSEKYWSPDGRSDLGSVPRLEPTERRVTDLSTWSEPQRSLDVVKPSCTLRTVSQRP
jgi:hypothetical protein